MSGMLYLPTYPQGVLDQVKMYMEKREDNVITR